MRLIDEAYRVSLRVKVQCQRLNVAAGLNTSVRLHNIAILQPRIKLRKASLRI